MQLAVAGTFNLDVLMPHIFLPAHCSPAVISKRCINVPAELQLAESLIFSSSSSKALLSQHYLSSVPEKPSLGVQSVLRILRTG